MPATVVVGAQYGGEGKGKTVAFLSKHLKPEIVIRCGGPNSGHTVSIDGEPTVLRMVPTGYVNPSSRLLLAPGSLIDTDVLLGEAERLGLGPDRLGIDFRATIIEAEDRAAESSVHLRERLGSTLCGVGAAVARRALRDGSVRHASDIEGLRPFVSDVPQEVHQALAGDRRVIVEGTQGFGLSLYHGEAYPFATSRDTTAAAFMSEVGLGAKFVDEVVVVARTFPIRVGGNSGPLPYESTWEAIQAEAGSPDSVVESTTVTGRPRRVGRFDFGIVQRALDYNGATGMVVNGLDLLDYSNRGMRLPTNLTHKVVSFLDELEGKTQIPILLAGTGPDVSDFVPWRWRETEKLDALEAEARQ